MPDETTTFVNTQEFRGIATVFETLGEVDHGGGFIIGLSSADLKQVARLACLAKTFIDNLLPLDETSQPHLLLTIPSLANSMVAQRNSPYLD